MPHQFAESDKKDADLAIPYVHEADLDDNRGTGSMLTQTLPMLAMFLRSKPVAWVALASTVQTFLNEPINSEGTPAIMNVFTGLLCVIVAYTDFVFIPTLKQPAPAAN